MPSTQLLDRLLADIELELELDDLGYCGLDQFSWGLSDHRDDLSEDEVTALCRAAYDEVVRRRLVPLVWLTWPVGEGQAPGPVEPDVALDVDLDPGAPVGTPFLALVDTP